MGLIRANFHAIAAAVQPLGVMCVLKANAYGLAVRPIAACLRQAGAGRFGVAELRGAAALRDLGVPIAILGGLLDDEIPAAVEMGVVCPLTDVAVARALSVESVRQRRTTTCHFLIDSGMGRLGIQLPQAEQVIAEVVELPGLNCNGIYSHFPSACGDDDFSRRQVTGFRHLLDHLDARGLTFECVHMANTDGVLHIDESLCPPFNLVRTGLGLYGCLDVPGRRPLALREVLTLKARLVAVRDLPRGASLGYDRTCRLEQPTRVGVVGIGYADGLPFSLSGRGRVRVRGRDCPILGRVSMDYTSVSLEDVPDAQVGDEVICIGDGIRVAEWAAAKGTISYEILCSFGHRVERRHVG